MAIWLQQYGEGKKLGREEQLVYQHCIMEKLPVRFFSKDDLDSPDFLKPDCSLVVGSIEAYYSALRILGKANPSPDCYPDCLDSFYHRKIIVGNKYDVIAHMANDVEVFAKPKEHLKLFTGQVFSGDNGYSILSELDEKTPLYLAEVVDLLNEYRVYVMDNNILAICQYSGDDETPIDVSIVEEAITIMQMSDKLNGTYTLDWGINKKTGETVLIEFNDAFSIGAYKGITASQYYELLQARWNQLTKRIT